MNQPPRLVTRLLTAEAVVIGVGGLTLLAIATLVAPGLFHDHLARIDQASPEITRHAEQAFASAFAIAITLAMLTSLLAAGVVSWFLVRRIARPVESLADAAETLATGDYRVEVPEETFARELDALATSFSHMADRLATTDQTRTRLLADLAHEIRTPLATLEAYIDGMEDGVVDSSRESFATMRGQVNRLRRLASDLRDAAAAEEHALNLVLVDSDANTLVDDAVAAALPRYLTKPVALNATHSAAPVPVAADPERLGQVLSNLLDNALRHTPPGGHVEVGVTAVGDHVRITVTDDGQGIPRDQCEAVFDRFHRVDPSRTSDGSGSGLGLTIAKAIVHDHGGTITAFSDGLGTGATFSIDLPALW